VDVGRDDQFESFFLEMEPRLRRAFVGSHGVTLAGDAVAEALAWAWENWERLQTMENPAGYLYRVGRSRTRPRKRLRLPGTDVRSMPEVEPGLVPALIGLPRAQRTAVWLVHGCAWRYSEVAEAMGISSSTVGTHVNRGLASLRLALGARLDG
jgi:DNA-directed RNA polymerase specialized sigma24 family protein